MELPLQGVGRRGKRRQVDRGQVFGELDLRGSARQEVALDPEQDRLGRCGGRLATPLRLDVEEPGHENRQRPGRGDQKPGPGQGIPRFRVGAVGPQPDRQVRVLAGQPLEKRPVEIGEAVLAMQVLVAESGLAKREVPLGGDRRGRGFQAADSNLRRGTAIQ